MQRDSTVFDETPRAGLLPVGTKARLKPELQTSKFLRNRQHREGSSAVGEAVRRGVPDDAPLSDTLLELGSIRIRIHKTKP